LKINYFGFDVLAEIREALKRAGCIDTHAHTQKKPGEDLAGYSKDEGGEGWQKNKL